MRVLAFLCPPVAAALIAGCLYWSKQSALPTAPPLDIALVQSVHSVINILVLFLLGLGMLLILKDKRVGMGNRKGFYVVWYLLLISLMTFLGGLIIANLS